MFKINQPIRTINNELVIPFLVDGRSVFILDKDKNERIIDLSEFDFEQKKNKIKNNLVVVEQSTSIAQEEIIEEVKNESAAQQSDISLDDSVGVIVVKHIPVESIIMSDDVTNSIVSDFGVTQNIVNDSVVPTVETVSVRSDNIVLKEQEIRNIFVFKNNEYLKFSNRSITSLLNKMDTSIADDFYGGL